jgi:hypothetical protein
MGKEEGHEVREIGFDRRLPGAIEFDIRSVVHGYLEIGALPILVQVYART